MLKAIVNRCDISFQFKNVTPMLIKDGRYEPELGAGWPAGIFQCRDPRKVMHDRVRAGQFELLTYFVPASTIRGVFRSHLERIVRSLSPDAPIACDPFVPEVGCGFLKETDYAASCPICRLFGSTQHAGRITFEDGIEVEKQRRSVQLTDQIQIDRFTGSVGEGPFRWMLLSNATFETKLSVRNFELWQLGLLAYLFQDLGDQMLQMGMGKNLDRGRIHSDPKAAKITLTYCRGDGSLKGMYDLVSDPKYKFVPREDKNGLPGLLRQLGVSDLWTTWKPNDPDAQTFWDALKPTWNEAIKHFPSRRYPKES